MGTPRQTQHRGRKETQEVRAKEVAEFRAENQRLRREVKRLRSELDKYSSAWGSNSTGEPEEPMAKPEVNGIPVVIATEFKEGCPQCGGPNQRRVKMGPKTIIACPDCGSRKVE